MGPLLELFSGLGAAGLAWGGPVAGAVDQSAAANETYALNHGRRPDCWNLAAVREQQLAGFQAPRWWLSPPCQPYTVRGAARDLDDQRARALIHLLPLIQRLRPAVIAMDRVSKRFGSFAAVDDVSIEVVEGEFFALLGPSGCGKTTSLRMMAGFERPDTGSIVLRGRDVTDVPPNRRPVNLVFQNYELFPHMTVFQNVAYGLRLRGVAKREIQERVGEMLDVVRVTELAARYPRTLSGGQQQRVALARALVNRPAVLLLDEPLSALDVKLRKQMQLELKAIQHSVGTAFVYVTHDQEEALLMSDRVAIMDRGQVLQVGTPRQIYERPGASFVAEFVGSLSRFVLRIDALHDGVALMHPAPDERVAVRVPDGIRDVGSQLRAAVRPERIRLMAAGTHSGPTETALHGVIEAIDYVGTLSHYRVVTSLGTLLSHRLNEDPIAAPPLGASVTVIWSTDAAFVLPD